MILEYVGNCSDPSIAKIGDMDGRKASYKKACRLIKKQYPELYHSLALKFYNPWEDETKYITYAGNKYLCLVHSMIDYLFLIK